ncbi:MAG: LiaI-LiaF-like domain-containing protein, partial [Candidatus Zixiibacteriota bacterium]
MTSPRSLRWGVILISAGVLWLLVSADIISPHVVEYLFYLWPVLLIAIGIELVFRGSKLKALAYLSPLMLAIVAFLAGQEAYYVEQNYDHRSGGSFVREIPAGETLQTHLELGDYDLYVRARSDNKVRGRMTGAYPSPKVEYSSGDGVTTVDVRDNPALFGWRWGWNEFHSVLNASNSRYPELRVDLPQNTPVKMTLDGEESNADLNLADVSLAELIANVDEVTLSLEIGNSQPLVDVTLNG